MVSVDVKHMEEEEEYNLTRQTLENQHYRGFDCMNSNH